MSEIDDRNDGCSLNVNFLHWDTSSAGQLKLMNSFFFFVFILSNHRIMALSRKLTAMNENISCDPLFLGKVVYFHIISWTCCNIFFCFFIELVVILFIITAYFQVGRERQRFDFDDFDPVPQKFNIWINHIHPSCLHWRMVRTKMLDHLNLLSSSLLCKEIDNVLSFLPNP
jgi:hypothetical protein